MKLPKLKYYYLGLTAAEYQEFEHSRCVRTSPVSIDPVSGTVSGRPRLTLWVSPVLADDHVRVQGYAHSVYVLRIPRELIDRDHLRRVTPSEMQYVTDLQILHCGVERFDLAQPALTS